MHCWREFVSWCPEGMWANQIGCKPRRGIYNGQWNYRWKNFHSSYFIHLVINKSHCVQLWTRCFGIGHQSQWSQNDESCWEKQCTSIENYWERGAQRTDAAEQMLVGFFLCFLLRGVGVNKRTKQWSAKKFCSFSSKAIYFCSSYR